MGTSHGPEHPMAPSTTAAPTAAPQHCSHHPFQARASGIPPAPSSGPRCRAHGELICWAQPPGWSQQLRGAFPALLHPARTCVPAMGPNLACLSSGKPRQVPATPRPAPSLLPGVFLIPYFIMSLIMGLPLFLMELSLGQYGAAGPITIWNCCPLLKGGAGGRGHLSCLPPQPLGPAGLWEGVWGGHGGWDTLLARSQSAPQVPRQTRAGLLLPLQPLEPTVGLGVCQMRADPCLPPPSAASLFTQALALPC